MPDRFQLDAVCEEQRARLLDCVVWIFFDFISLYQYCQDSDQRKLFNLALGNMHVLYAHELIEVQIIEVLTPKSVRGLYTSRRLIPVYWEKKKKGKSKKGNGEFRRVPVKYLKLNATPYEERGWCQAEKQWASHRASLKGDSVPLPPEMFRKQMGQLKFTHRSDSDKVLELQQKYFYEKAACTTQLLVERLNPEKLAVLLAALPFYTGLKEVMVKASPAQAWKVALAVVMSGACELLIECRSLLDEDAIGLAADLSKACCAHIQRVQLNCDFVGETGRDALQQAMKQHDATFVIQALDLGRNSVGQEVEDVPPEQDCAALHILVSKRKQLAKWPATARHPHLVARHAGSPNAFGNATKCPLTIRCLAGPAFELDVNALETGLDVGRRVAERTGRPAECLRLTSGGRIIDHRHPLLQQVQDQEVTYVVVSGSPHRAAADGDVATLLCLYDYGEETRKSLADKDIHGWVPAQWAAKNGRVQVLQLLYDLDETTRESLTAPKCYSLAQLAARSGHVGVLQLLFDLDEDTRKSLTVSDPDGWAPAHWAAQNGQVGVLQLLYDLDDETRASLTYRDRWCWMPACLAAENGHVAVLQLFYELDGEIRKSLTLQLRKNKANTDICLWTPAHLAAQNGHAGVLQLLYDVGFRKSLAQKTVEGWDPALLALNEGHVGVLQLLQNLAGRYPSRSEFPQLFKSFYFRGDGPPGQYLTDREPFPGEVMGWPICPVW